MHLSDNRMSESASVTPPHHAAAYAQAQDDSQNYSNPSQLTHNLDNLQRIPTLPSQVQIHPITSDTVASYRRLITLLLPIRYADKFYKESVANPTESSLARVATWDDSCTSGVPAPGELINCKVVGGIQCRLEDIPSKPPEERQLYIQTIAVLSPFRQLGIATHLLYAIISTILEHYERTTSIYAHVWEASSEALEWYDRRGFVIEGEVIKDYYRRLKPSGARVVRRRIGVEDHLAFRRRETKKAERIP